VKLSIDAHIIYAPLCRVNDSATADQYSAIAKAHEMGSRGPSAIDAPNEHNR
jgi:hypothetical protein